MKSEPMESETETDDSPEEDAQEKKWMAESDLRSLIEAEKIKADPKRLKAAMAAKREQMDALKNIKTA